MSNEAVHDDFGPVEQIAYVVANIETAMEDHARTFGSGPYFLNDAGAIDCVYRGAEAKLDVKFALGQWGNVQLEFIEVNTKVPSVFDELGVPPSPGAVFHHVCFLPTD